MACPLFLILATWLWNWHSVLVALRLQDYISKCLSDLGSYESPYLFLGNLFQVFPNCRTLFEPFHFFWSCQKYLLANKTARENNSETPWLNELSTWFFKVNKCLVGEKDPSWKLFGLLNKRYWKCPDYTI